MGKLKATAKAVDSLVDKVSELVRLGYPESTAKKIASGELPMDQASRMARAREQGYNSPVLRGKTEVYHGTDQDISTLDPSLHDEYPIEAISTTPDPDYASGYAMDTYGRRDVTDSPAVYPLMVRGKASSDGEVLDAISRLGDDAIDDMSEAEISQYLLDEGITSFDAFGVGDEVAVLDPTAVRSRFAAFDPDQKDSSNLLAGLGAGAVGIGLAGQSEDADAGVISKGGKKIIEAFHGSPHKFDRFSMDAIGTGEGAQAYGHGLYFADSEDVARGYKEMLREKGPSNLARDTVKLLRGQTDKKFTESAVQSVYERMQRADKTPSEAVDEIFGGYADDPAAGGLSRLDTDDLVSAIEQTVKDSGSLYRAHIDVDPDTLLDWDKPLSEQSEAVQRALEEFDPDSYSPIGADYDPSEQGQMIYQRLANSVRNKNSMSTQDINARLSDLSKLMDSDSAGGYRQFRSDVGRKAAEEYDRLLDLKTSPEALERNYKPQVDLSSQLNQSGIRGIRYADGMSRGKDGGTYNYVMFDDKPISIQERGNASPEMLAVTAAASGFLASRQEKQGRWDSLRADLMGALNTANNAAEFAFDALEVPWKGILGASRVAGGLASGESFEDAMFAGADQTRQTVDQTAYDLGGVTTDYTGSPALGTAVNVATTLGGPI